SVDHRVEAEVVFGRVSAHEKVVLAVLRAEDDAAACVFHAGDRTKTDGDVDIVEALVLENRDRPWLGFHGLRQHRAGGRGAAEPLPGDELPLRVLPGEILFQGHPRAPSASRSFGSFASPKPTAGIATTPIIVNHAATVSSLIIALLLLAS